MKSDRPTAAPGMSNDATMSKLLDLLTAIKWDLKSGLSDGAAAPEVLAGDIRQIFDGIDGLITGLREILYQRELPLESRAVASDHSIQASSPDEAPTRCPMN